MYNMVTNLFFKLYFIILWQLIAQVGTEVKSIDDTLLGNTSDAVPLYLPQNLYLKPIARIHVSVQLPQQIEPGKSISNWEIMEKLRAIIKPEEFPILKVSKSTLEFIRFEAELDDKSKLKRVLNLIDGKTMQLNAFRHPAKVRAAEAKLEFPNRHSWDSFFRDAKNMDEMKPGERPDTIHFSNLPIKWFVPLHLCSKDGLKPSERIFQRIFENFGQIRNVDIPICDPYRSKMKEHMTGMRTFTFDQDTLFEGYVQFKDYIGFTRTMDAFRGMKLLRKDSNEAQTINITVDFDKTKHLSDASIRRRHIVRERLIAKDREREEKDRQDKEKLEQEEQAKRQRELQEKEEKERRQREREERRKARHFAQLKLKETEELKKRIAKEEKKLLKAQRKLEAIRLVGELFERLKIKKEKDKALISDIDKNSRDEVTKMKTLREKKVQEQRDKLHKTLEGRVVLNSILGDDKQDSSTDSSSDTNSDKNSKSKHKKKKRKKKKKKSKSHKAKKEKEQKEEKATVEPPYPPPTVPPFPIGDPGWFGCMPSNPMYPFPPMFAPPIRGAPPAFFPFPGIRGRGINGLPGPSRPMFPRRRGSFNPHWTRGWRGRRGGLLPHYTPELEKEYYKYFTKFLEDDRKDASSSYSRSRSRSYSRSRSRHRSYTKSRPRRRSYSRSSSRSRSRSTSRSRSRSRRSRRSRTRSRTRSRHSSRCSHKSRSKGRSRSRRSTRSRRSRTHSRPRSNRRPQIKNSSRSPSYRSIDSSKFISPSRLRAKQSRSKSWSLPRSTTKRSSWSKSPTPLKKNQ